MTDTIRGASWGDRDRAAGDRAGWGRRAAFAVGGVLGLLALVGVVAVSSLNASIDRVDVEGLGADPPPVGAAGGAGDAEDGEATEDRDARLDARALTVLVLGSDSREVLTPEERRELGTGDAEGERTEVISLMRLDPDGGVVRMLSIPRDTLLTRCDGSTGRVNAAYALGEESGRGGATCVVQTLRDWLGVRIDHVVKVDFRGFVDIVDALGGVSIHTEEPLQDTLANLDLRAGCNRLDGAASLAFVRARHIDNDFGRMGRQQRFLTELRNELAEVGVFDDPARTFRVAEAVARAVELDDTLTLNRIQQLVREHRATIEGGIDGRVLTGEIETINEAAYVVVDQQQARASLRWLITGEDPADRAAADAGADAGAATEPGATATDDPVDDPLTDGPHGSADADDADHAAATGEPSGAATGNGDVLDRSAECR